jgi:osmotically-inducible protein OsmY
MARNTIGNPRSYEEIVRKTVVDPDSSARPTLAQERVAHEGFRAVDADEQAIHDRVVQALAAAGVDASGVTIEVDRELVTLRGRVADATVLRTLADTVASVPGVSTIHDRIVVGPDSSP